MKQWTPGQTLAITAPPGDLLVSAGAGAGKTAVLVERVLRRIIGSDGAGRFEQPVDVDRLLVVTFTEAAAAEMKSRIATRIEELLQDDPDNPLLLRQLALLPRAAISTLHSFCLRVIRQHFHQLKLDPTVRVIDENVATILRHDVLMELLEQRFAALENDVAAGATQQGFRELVEQFSGSGSQNLEALKSLILDIYRLAVTQPDPDGWLDSLTDAFAVDRYTNPEDGPLAPLLVQLKAQIQFTLEQGLWRLRHALALCQLPDGPAGYSTTLLDDVGLLEFLLDSVERKPWQQLRQLFEDASFSRLRGIRGDSGDEQLREQVKKLRDEVRKSVQQLRERFFRPSWDRQLQVMGSLHNIVAALVDLVRQFDQAYRRAKESIGGLDYNDLERYCLALLCEDGDPTRPSRFARSLSERFVEVVVDEYQDINPLQDAILGLLAGDGSPGQDGSRPRRFMVGDVRQSIYRFRMAEPSLFLKRRDEYPLLTEPAGGTAGDHTRHEPGAVSGRIELQHNFRSRPSILKAVNFIFRQLFATAVGQLGDSAAAGLQPGIKYDGPDPAVELHILERDPGELVRHGEGDPSASRPEEREAVFVARMIRQLLGMDGNEPESVWPPGEDRRPLRPGDIAILLRSPRHRANTFVEILSAYGIPATAELRTGYLDALEVNIFINLLRVIDNPQQDIPLASVLHSPLVGLEAEDLAQIRLAATGGSFFDACQAMLEKDGSGQEWHSQLVERLRSFFDNLDGWRSQARRQPLAELIWQLFNETGFKDYVAGMPGGPQRVENLKRLLQLAAEHDRYSRQGLSGFLHFLEQLSEKDIDLGAATTDSAADDAVQIMSVHQSKGLEFPVVFVVDLGRRFNRDDLDAPILIHRDLGLGPRFVHRDRGVQVDSIARLAIRHRLWIDALAEEMRVLYVAMTRARERLVLVGSVRDMPKKVRQWSAVAYHRPEPLPDALLADANSVLDWIGPCLARHRDGRPLRELAAFTGMPANESLFNDSSRWQVNIWTGTEVLELQRPRAGIGDADDAASAGDGRGGGNGAGGGPDAGKHLWRLLEAGEPLPAGVAGEKGAAQLTHVMADLDRRLQGVPLTFPASGYFAKVSVTELSRRTAVLNDGDEDAFDASAGDPRTVGDQPWALPRFMRGEEEPEASGIEIGTATHLTLQHLDLSDEILRDISSGQGTGERDLILANLNHQLKRLVERGLLTADQARLVPVRGLATFFCSDLGRRFLQAAQAGSLRRELPFSLRMAADEVYGTLAPREEWVLVQGVIDALWEENEQLYILDFKTDRVGPRQAHSRAQMYARQMSYYMTAAGAIFDRRVDQGYLCFVRTGVVIPFEPTQPGLFGPGHHVPNRSGPIV